MKKLVERIVMLLFLLGTGAASKAQHTFEDDMLTGRTDR